MWWSNLDNKGNEIHLHYTESSIATQVFTLAIKTNDNLLLRRGFQKLSRELRRGGHNVNRNGSWVRFNVIQRLVTWWKIEVCKIEVSDQTAYLYRKKTKKERNRTWIKQRNEERKKLKKLNANRSNSRFVQKESEKNAIKVLTSNRTFSGDTNSRMKEK